MYFLEVDEVWYPLLADRVILAISVIIFLQTRHDHISYKK